MREIKFRVWDIFCKEYLVREKAALGDCDKRESYIYIYRSPTDGSSNTLEWMIDDPECFLIEQYTGLKDKNGREIYEGDILRSGKTGSAYPIVFDVNASGFVASKPRTYFAPYCWEQGEIIGNIHENPELLTT
jgi:uncharacterized phage protein (TIGR01671 family)